MSYEGPRGTRKEEFGKVMELVNSIFVGAREKGTTMEEGFPRLFSHSNLDNMRIMLLDGKPVSHIGISMADGLLYGCKLKIGMIGAVGTDPEHRNKGLAGKLLSDCMSKLFTEGADFLMVSGIRSLYNRAGCVMAGRAHAYALTDEGVRRAFGHLAFPCEVQEYDRSRLRDLLSIYEMEPVRYIRTREDFATLIGPRTYAMPRIFLIDVGGEPAAYVCIEPEHGDEGVSRVVEYAGSRGGIVAAIPRILSRLGAGELEFTVPHHDLELLGLLSSIERPRANHFGGTMCMISPQGFLEKVKPHLISRMGEKAEGLVFTNVGDRPVLHFDGEKLEFESGRDLTWFLFGQPEATERRFGQYLRPVSIKYEGDLAGTFNDIFPLPTFLYGLNYT
jgi:predicted N-acetyltransferase YhbS